MLGDYRAQLRVATTDGHADLVVVLGRAARAHGVGVEPLLVIVVHERAKLSAGLLGGHPATASPGPGEEAPRRFVAPPAGTRVRRPIRACIEPDFQVRVAEEGDVKPASPWRGPVRRTRRRSDRRRHCVRSSQAAETRALAYSANRCATPS